MTGLLGAKAKKQADADDAVGLAALRKLLPPRPLDVAELRGKTVAVDADNLLWSFVTAFGATGGEPVAPDGRPYGHVLGLTGRLALYSEWGVRSCWIFDGEQPALKAATLAARAARLEASEGIALAEGQIAEAKALLTALGVPWKVAPAESDPQCVRLVRDARAALAVTQDYDAALHGCPRTARNLTRSKTRTPEVLELAPALDAAGLTREALVDVAILIGTDYNDGVVGVGPVKAVKLVKKHGDAASALKAIGAEVPRLDEVRRLFLDHPVDASYQPRWRRPDEEAVARLLGGFGLSRARGDGLCAALAPLHASPA